jgi:archaeal flagellar protein FlaI
MMVLFNKDKGLFSYDLIREGEDVILKVNCEDYIKTPSLEDDPVLMSKTVDLLAEAGTVTKIIFQQKREYEYESEVALMLVEISKLYNQFVKQKIISYYGISNKMDNIESAKRYSELQYIIFQLLKSDPLAAYTETKRILRREKIRSQKIVDNNFLITTEKYISVLNYMLGLLEKTKIINLAKHEIVGYKIGDRSLYSKLMTSTIKPDFMFTKLMASYPEEGEELGVYTMENTEVTIFSLPNSVQNLYHIIPPEFKLTEEKYEILDTARKIMSEHKPKKSEFVDPERMRDVFYKVGHDLVEEVCDYKKIKLKSKEIDELTDILVRYTVGFGLIELLLQDPKVQDITINSPMGQTPIFLIHEEFGDCKTNIIPTVPEAESWASKLRMISGRPLDEANPVLDTELSIPGARARIAVVSPPLNPSGLAYAFRRHRDKPWTLPLFIENKMLNPLAAGIMSFVIDGSRTILVAGTRSAGKSSFLGSLLVELMRKYRIITIEDTLELPVGPLRKMGYNIQQLKVASALTQGTTEVSAEEGIRTTLRMGDSALIIGEVRSTEAKALYEAMRIGASANVVAGTIHADSPYGIYDRVVNDLGVPKTSFKATDLAIIANPIRSADGLHRVRRITQITEVRKFWETDPLLEKGFGDLMTYDSKLDSLEPSSDLLNGDSDLLKSIAGNVKEWAGNWDSVWDNILLRAKIKETQVDIAKKMKIPSLLEAEAVILANDEFHKISDAVKEEVGFLDSKRIFFEWNEWLKRSIKKQGLIKDV